MRQDEKFTFYEGFCLLTLTFLYHEFNEVLPNLVVSTGCAAWIAQCVSALSAFAYLALFLWLFRIYRNMDLLQVFDTVYGKYLGKAMHFLVLLYLLFYSAVCLNQSVELMQIYAYSEISALEIDLLMMGAVCVFALYSIKGMAKTVSIFLPAIFFTIVVILLASHKQYDKDLLTPILGNGMLVNIKSGLMLLSEFGGFLVLSIFMGSFGSYKAFKKCGLWAIAAASSLFVFTTLCYNMAIPYNCAMDLMVGVLGIAQSNHSSRFLQRLESVFIAVTVMAIVLLLGISFLAIKKVYCHLFSITKRHSKSIIVPLGLIIVCIARTMNNRLLFKNAVRVIIRRYGIVFCAGVLVLTLLVTYIRRLGKSKGMRAASAMLVLVLVCSGFSGCTHYREPDSEVYPIIMGYDKGDKEKFRITMKFMLDSKTDEGKMAEQEEADGERIPKDMVVVEAPSFTEGINMINSLIPKRVSMLHIKMLVISEEIAKDGIGGIVGPLIRYNEIKPTMAFVVCRTSAYDFITAERATLTDSLQLDMELILESKKENTSYFVTSISEVLYNYKGGYGDAVAMLGSVSQTKYGVPKGDDSDAEFISDTPHNFEEGFLSGELPIVANNEMELAGMAVFHGDKMVGVLDTQETEIVIFTNNMLNTASLSIHDPYNPEEYYVSLQIRKVQPIHTETWIDGDGITHIEMEIPLNAAVGVSQNPEVNYITNPENRRTLSDAIEEELNQRAAKLFEKLQKEYKADVLQFGRKVSGNFLTIPEWEAYNWPEQYPNAEINVSFIVNL